MVFCPNCGTRLTEDTQVCQNCGTNIYDVNQDQPQSFTQQSFLSSPPSSPPPQPQPPPPTYTHIQQQYHPIQQSYIPPPPPVYPQQPYMTQWPPMTIGNWMATQLLMLIPIANIILVFVWAFGSNVNPSKKTYFQAQLIWALIWTGFFVIIAIIASAFVASIFYNLANIF